MAAAASNFGTPSWLSDPGMNNPAFDAFLQSIAQDRANYDPAFGFTNTPVSSLYQELGEGNQGQQLLKMFQGGLTADQVHNAYYGQYGGVDPAAVTALGSTDPSQLTGQMKTLYDQGLLQYTPAVAGDPGQTADTPASYSLAQPVTHFGSDPTVAQPLFGHSTQTGLNTGAFGFNPSSGFVTSPGNVHGSSSNTFLDNIVPILSMATLGSIGGAALGPMLGSLSKLGGPLFSNILNMLQGGKFNPSSMVGAGVQTAAGGSPLQSILNLLGGIGK